jgi:anthranilate synthase component 1
MFLLDLKDFRLIGSSPEVLVRVEGSKVTTRPLAGTRRRGRCPTEDRHLEDDLLSDEKERAEHLMLVDLARNDLGRVCVPGTVKVTELMGIEKYSKVMHIVSNVEGIKRWDCTFLDVLRSTFPAGTVSGAPKVRAMEIIEELEPDARGPYAGAVGYIGFGGDMDMCITIRTFLQEGGKLHVQAGAGIVYDSVPEKEYEETKNKAKALIKILEGQRTKGVA